MSTHTKERDAPTWPPICPACRGARPTTTNVCPTCGVEDVGTLQIFDEGGLW